jgi:hypothetical protein
VQETVKRTCYSCEYWSFGGFCIYTNTIGGVCSNQKRKVKVKGFYLSRAIGGNDWCSDYKKAQEPTCLYDTDWEEEVDGSGDRVLPVKESIPGDA